LDENNLLEEDRQNIVKQNPPDRKRVIIRSLPWVCVALIILVMFVSSSKSRDDSHQYSMPVASAVYNMIQPAINVMRRRSDLAIIASLNLFIRKAAHVLLFYALTLFVILGMRGVTRRKKLAYISSFFIVLLIACLDEFHQFFSDGRNADPYDVGLDMLGAAFAYISIPFFNLAGKIGTMLSK